MKNKFYYFKKTIYSNTYAAEEIRENLIDVAKKIARIEDKTPDYTKNENWLKLRGRQDRLYEMLRREECLSNQQNKINTLTK